MQAQNNQAKRIFSVAIDCGRKVLMAAAVIVAAVIAVGKVIGEYDEIAAGASKAFAAVLSALTVGGSFWGSVAVAGIAMAALAWSACVYRKIYTTEHRTGKPRTLWFAFSLLGNVVLSIMAVMLVRMGPMTPMTPYHAITIFVICLGSIILFGTLIMDVNSMDVNSFLMEPTYQVKQTDTVALDKRMTFLARIVKWGLSQEERERVMGVFNTSGEVAAIEAARGFSKNVPEYP